MIIHGLDEGEILFEELKVAREVFIIRSKLNLFLWIQN